ncbi:hypothetical protein [Streptomyces sp. t39]|uniref:hypothetical protein n=1 Tax=Streptomyces sp. t39 TaxID=1828156 RepID=UPI00164F12A8|nr:hypothetical protein [Streptomyces sp. t39]
MPIDPFAALHAMVRAEAARTAVPEDADHRAEPRAERRPDAPGEPRRVIGGEPAAS